MYISFNLTAKTTTCELGVILAGQSRFAYSEIPDYNSIVCNVIKDVQYSFKFLNAYITILIAADKVNIKYAISMRRHKHFVKINFSRSFPFNMTPTVQCELTFIF